MSSSERFPTRDAPSRISLLISEKNKRMSRTLSDTRKRQMRMSRGRRAREAAFPARLKSLFAVDRGFVRVFPATLSQPAILPSFTVGRVNAYDHTRVSIYRGKTSFLSHFVFFSFFHENFLRENKTLSGIPKWNHLDSRVLLLGSMQAYP